jgi:hypothetical protein
MCNHLFSARSLSSLNLSLRVTAACTVGGALLIRFQWLFFFLLQEHFARFEDLPVAALHNQMDQEHTPKDHISHGSCSNCQRPLAWLCPWQWCCGGADKKQLCWRCLEQNRSVKKLPSVLEHTKSPLHIFPGSLVAGTLIPLTNLLYKG